MDGRLGSLAAIPGENRRRAVKKPPKLISQWNEVPTAGHGPLRMHARVGHGNGGGKPALVLVPGLVVTSRNVGPTAEHLQETFSVYALDLPGFGQSDKPPRVLDVPALATALLAWMDAAGLPDAHLLGNSFGCQVIAEVACRAPERIKSLVLTGPALDPAIRNWWQPVWRLGLDAVYEPSLIGPVFYDFWEMGPGRVLSTFRVCLADRIETKLACLKMPTLLIRGERDLIARAGWLDHMRQLLPSAQAHTVPRAPHAIAWSTPEHVAALAGPFCLACERGEK